MTNQTINLNNQLYQYYLSVATREPEILTDLRNQTLRLSSHKMQIAPEEGQFLSFLTQTIQARKTIDVGVYTGYSSLVVALSLPSDGRVIGCDINHEWTKIAAKFWEKADVKHKIDLRIAPAAKTLEDLINQGEENTFDFVFIDADKQNYDLYYELSLRLLRKGGVIAIDNVLWGGRVADSADQDPNTIAIRELNQKLVSDSRISFSMVPIADGLTLALKL